MGSQWDMQREGSETGAVQAKERRKLPTGADSHHKDIEAACCYCWLALSSPSRSAVGVR